MDANGNLSRMSTAAVAVASASGVRLPTDDHAADTSRTSVNVSAPVADISLPPVPDVAMPEVPMPAPIDDISVHAGSSIVEPLSVARAEDFGDDTAFDETLKSAAADLTLFAVSFLSLQYTQLVGCMVVMPLTPISGPLEALCF